LCLHGVLISWALIASTLGPSWRAACPRAAQQLADGAAAAAAPAPP